VQREQPEYDGPRVTTDDEKQSITLQHDRSPPTTTTRDEIRQPPPHPIVRVSRSMGVCCASHHFHPSFTSRVRWVYALPATTSTHCSRLAFDGCVLSQPPPPPIVRVSRSMGVCCPNHHLHPSFAQRVQLRFPLVRVSRSVRLCRASQHLHPSSASRV